MTEPLYIICWRDKFSKKETRGKYRFPQTEAEQVVRELNASFQHREHWLEPAGIAVEINIRKPHSEV